MFGSKKIVCWQLIDLKSRETCISVTGNILPSLSSHVLVDFPLLHSGPGILKALSVID